MEEVFQLITAAHRGIRGGKSVGVARLDELQSAVVIRVLSVGSYVIEQVRRCDPWIPDQVAVSIKPLHQTEGTAFVNIVAIILFVII